VTEPGFSELRDYGVDPATADLLPAEFCLERLVAIVGPLPAPGEPITLGMVDPNDVQLIADVSERLGRTVHPVQLNRYEVRRALGLLHGVAQVTREGLADVALSARREISFDPERPASALLDDLLSVAVQSNATDVHIETYRNDVDLRLRIDTNLRQVTTPLSPENVNEVIARLKVVCELDPLERRRAQDGHFLARYRHDAYPREIDFRVSVVPGQYGEDAVIRILDPLHFRLELNDLDLPPAALERYRRVVRHPDGLVLITGPTLSGKTNTLYATIRDLLDEGLKIVTVEDPIEFDFPKVNQKSVTDAMGFADFVHAFLRQNPDVIVVGEVRDADTADVVARAATTGHLVLSTVHTRDAVGAVARLRALGVNDDTLASILVASAGQRLVRRVCQACSVAVDPPEALQRLYYEAPPAHPFREGRGCAECGESGYDGVVALFELFETDAHIETAIARGAPVEELRRVAMDQGFRSLAEDALAKVADGVTSLREISRRIAPLYR
jgi:general secretion pathway protein E/type IV pilus assembly protein PilB